MQAYMHKYQALISRATIMNFNLFFNDAQKKQREGREWRRVGGGCNALNAPQCSDSGS